MNSIILYVIIYGIGCAVIMFPRLCSNKIKIKAKCIEIKKDSNMECPVFEVNYNKEPHTICNECYTSNLEMEKGEHYNLYINKNDFNNFNYNNRKIYQYTDIFGIIILIFGTILLASVLNLNAKIWIGILFTILGGILILYNSVKMIELYRECTLRIVGKVSYFKGKKVETHDYEKSIGFTYEKYSPVYEINYKDSICKISNTNYYRFATKIVKQGEEYKLRISPNIPNIYVDRLVILSKLMGAFLGIGVIALGILITIH